jgi:hypothetical protein
MQKLFPLQVPGRADPRVVEAVKYDVRRYLRRERRKTLPEGFSQWDFNCKAGPDRATAIACDVAQLGAAIEAVANAGGPAIFIEILAAPGHRSLPAPAN